MLTAHSFLDSWGRSLVPRPDRTLPAEQRRSARSAPFRMKRLPVIPRSNSEEPLHLLALVLFIAATLIHARVLAVARQVSEEAAAIR